MKNLKNIIIAAILSVTTGLQAQIPERSNPPRLLNDFAGILSRQQTQRLETDLTTFARTTSNQIAVVIVNDLNGLSVSDFAYQIGEKWGVGQGKFDNGIVVLIKVKNQTDGEVFIATGYGLEAVLPDATCKKIIENEMIPAFRENDYYTAIVKALEVIMPIAKGEFSHEDYGDKVPLAAIIVILVIFILLAIVASKHKGDDFTGRNGNSRGISPMTAILLGSMLGGGGRSSGSFGGGGGFGGFGGGSFGGGGAGGRW